MNLVFVFFIFSQSALAQQHAVREAFAPARQKPTKADCPYILKKLFLNIPQNISKGAAEGRRPDWEFFGGIVTKPFPPELLTSKKGEPIKLRPVLQQNMTGSTGSKPDLKSSQEYGTIRNMLLAKGWKDETHRVIAPNGKDYYFTVGGHPEKPLFVDTQSPYLVGANINEFHTNLGHINKLLRELDPAGNWTDLRITFTDKPPKDFSISESENNLMNLNIRDVMEGRGNNSLIKLWRERFLLIGGNLFPPQDYIEEMLKKEGRKPGSLTMDEFLKAREGIKQLAIQGDLEAQKMLLIEEIRRLKLSQYYFSVHKVGEKPKLKEAAGQPLWEESAKESLFKQGYNIHRDVKLHPNETKFFLPNRDQV